MNSREEQLKAIEVIHQEYTAELVLLAQEQKQAVNEFLERVRQKKIAEITGHIQNL